MTGGVRAVLFDFGGVLSEEGFREGLKAIAMKHGLDPGDFFSTANELIHGTGYVVGMAAEHAYWNALREKTGIRGSDEELRGEIIKRFTLRASMLGYARQAKSSGCVVGILSDQTNWLDEIEEREHFFHHFDYVFNSFHLGKSKQNPSVFRDVCAVMGCRPGEVLFIDDNAENIERARSEGLMTILFLGAGDFQKRITTVLSSVGEA